MEKSLRLREIRKAIFLGIIGLYTVLVLAWILRYVFGSAWSNSSILYVFFFAIVSYLYKKTYWEIEIKKAKRSICYAIVNSIIFSTVAISGTLIKYRGYIFHDLWDIFINIFMVIGLIPLGIAVSLNVLQFLDRERKNHNSKSIAFSLNKYFFVTTIFIFLFWLPVLLSYYPAIFAYDVTNQLGQVINGHFSTFHPLVHTLFLGFFYKVGEGLGSYTFGMFLASIFQMVLMASIFSYSVLYVSDSWKNKLSGILAFLFYAFFPVNSLLAISTVKDSLFSVIVLWFVLECYKLRKVSFAYERKHAYSCFVVSGMLMFLFRNNAVYAFILMLPAYVVLIRKNKRTFLKWSIITIILYLVSSNILVALLKADGGNILEALSVPVQQIARVGIYDRGELDTDLQEEIRYYIPDDLLENYAEAISDGIKNFMDEEKVKKEPWRFLKLYLKLFLKFPNTYLDAFLIMTQGNWFWDDTSNANIYGSGLDSRLGYLLTNHKMMPEGYEVEEKCFLPHLRNAYEFLFSANYYQKMPVISFLFAPALYWWIVYLYVWIKLYQKKKEDIVPAVFLVGYYVTLLFGPVCLIRYMYPFVVCAPLLVHSVLEEHRNEMLL